MLDKAIERNKDSSTACWVNGDEALLAVEDLTKTFRVRGRSLHAVRGASFRLLPGQTLGIVGESGSGKSTLGRCILGLLKPDGGRVYFEGIDIATLSRKAMRKKRQDMQLIFQNPLAALNGRATVARNIMDPLTVHGILSQAERRRRVAELLERVGLSEAHGLAYPFELSGGQQQRVMIARALALGPKLVVCDEALSALDMSVQAQIIELMLKLQRDEQLSYVFISHNLSAVAYMSDLIAVMYLGEIVELAPTDALLERPQHPYTRALFDSILDMPESKETRAPLHSLPGEIPSPIDLPSGCAFHTRCPLATDLCRLKAPAAKMVGTNHQVQCHLAEGTEV